MAIPSKKRHATPSAVKPRTKALKPDAGAVKPPKPAAVVEDADPDFPRGGAILLSRAEAAEARAEAEEEFDREAASRPEQERKTKQKRVISEGFTGKHDADAEIGSLLGDGLMGRLPRFANRITLKVDEEKHMISHGMKKFYTGDDNFLVSGGAISGKLNGDTPRDDSLIAPDHTDMFLVPNQETGFGSSTGTESRYSVLPLQVSLSDSESSDMENELALSQDTKVIETVAKKGEEQLKKKTKDEREREISASEERSLQKDVPVTTDEFEKLVRNSPNSSFVWIKYMAFMLSLANAEKARSIAERALRTINIREEGERLNIWVAYFNLENEYGSPPEEAVSKTFQRALQYCDPKKLHLALLGIYDKTEQFKLADELVEKMTKKFRISCKVWLRSVQNLLKQGKDGTQSVVNRALLSLPRRKHMKFMSQTAILEFKCGVPDRGRAMFEGILREYPKRTDLWSVYLDQETHHGDIDLIRALFERATSLSLPQKKMRFLLKKYLKFEKAHGDEERIEFVKRKALEYAENSLT